jgi:hypothetical protein
MKFGWCMGECHHDSCRRETGGSRGILVCDCSCHVENADPVSSICDNGGRENGPASAATERGQRPPTVESEVTA